MTGAPSGGPWILGPPDRETRLLVGLFRSFGFWDTAAVDALPARGCVVVPAREAGRLESADRWASQRRGRLVLAEPADGRPVPLTGVPRRLGQRPQIPSAPPDDANAIDDAYLSEVASVALAGFQTRLSRRRPFPEDWRAYASRAIDELASKSDNPEALASLRAELGEPADLEPVSDQEWRDILGALDMRRGLFRRRDGDEPGWDFHPRNLWALATRIRRFTPRGTDPIEYGVFARGEAKGPWITQAGERSYRIRASILTAAAAEVDPPDLTYPYDFSHDAPPPPVHEVIDEAARLLDLAPSQESAEPFTLCVRHDVDRALSASDLQAHLRLEDELGLRSTWFFKQETYDENFARILLENDREIGYHAELLSTGDDGFIDRLRNLVGGPIGLSFHRGLGSEAWRGRRSIIEAQRLGASYAELPVGMRPRPQLLPIDDDSWIRLAPLAVEPEVFPERAIEHIDLMLPRRAVLVIENHPDLFPDRYVSLVSELAGRGPTIQTVGEAIESFLPNRALGPAEAVTF